MVSQSIRVNFNPSGVQDRLHASQYDTGERVFSFLCFYDSSLYEIPSGATVTLNGQKSGGYAFVIPCTYEGSTVTCDCTASMTDVSGLVTCELEVLTGGQVVQSGNFYLVVEPSAIDSGTIPSSDFEAISQMVADAQDSAERAEEAAASVDPSAFVSKTDLTTSKTQTATGQKAVDAVELNPNRSGTLANTVSNLNSAVVKKADLSSSGTVATQKQYAADAWQLNPNNTGSYAAGVASEIASLTNTSTASYTLASGVTRNTGQIYEDARAVYINMNLKTTITISTAMTSVITGLPIPLGGAAAVAVNVYNSTTTCVGRITNTGELQLRPQASLSNAEFFLQCVYFKN